MLLADTPPSADGYNLIWQLYVVQFPVAGAILAVAWYAFRELKSKDKTTTERIESLHAAEKARFEEAHRDLLAAKDKEIERLSVELGKKVDDLVKKVEKLANKLTG